MKVQKTLLFTQIWVVMLLFNTDLSNAHFLLLHTEEDFLKFYVGISVGSSSLSLFKSKSLWYWLLLQPYGWVEGYLIIMTLVA